MIADQKYQGNTHGEIQDERRTSIPEEGGNYVNVNQLLQQPAAKTGAPQGRNRLNRPHRTDFCQTEVAKGRKVALLNEDEHLAEAGQKVGQEVAARVAGGDLPHTRDLSRADQQKYQHSQLIKTEDKMLHKLIAFSLSQQAQEPGSAEPTG